MRWSKSKVKLLWFLGDNEGFSCLVYITPKSISTEPWGTIEITLLPKIVSKNLLFIYRSGIKFFDSISSPFFRPA